MDVTIFRPTDHSKIYIYFVVDNFSRISNWKASLTYSSTIAMNVLKDSKPKLGNDTTLITDGGPENHGDVTGFLTENNIKHQIAQKDIMQSNSMVEAVNKHLKYYYLFKMGLQDFDQTVKYLNQSVASYNSKPHGQLYGLTPDEVLAGKIPCKDNFKEQKQAARINRVIQNTTKICCQIEK